MILPLADAPNGTHETRTVYVKKQLTSAAITTVPVSDAVIKINCSFTGEAASLHPSASDRLDRYDSATLGVQFVDFECEPRALGLVECLTVGGRSRLKGQLA